MTCFASSGIKHLRYRWEKPLLYKISFIRTNREAWTFNFLVASFSFGRTLAFRLEINDVVQLLLGSTSYTFVPLSMSDEVWMKDNT